MRCDFILNVNFFSPWAITFPALPNTIDFSRYAP